MEAQVISIGWVPLTTTAPPDAHTCYSYSSSCVGIDFPL